MTVDTYSGLRDSISAWMKRSDLNDRIPDFVRLCEACMRREIRHDNGLSAQVTFNLGTDGERMLPDDFNGIIGLYSSNASWPVVEYVAPHEWVKYQGYTWGGPYYYTIMGNVLKSYPSQPDDVDLTLNYRQKLDLLLYGPNFIIENHYDAYLFGSLVEASAFMIEDERIPLWQARYEAAIASINQDGINLSLGDSMQMSSNGYEGQQYYNTRW